VTFEVDGFANLQKLTFYQVGLAHHYVRATAVVEKPRIFIAEPLLYDCLQKFTFNLILISLPWYQATPLSTLEIDFLFFNKENFVKVLIPFIGVRWSIHDIECCVYTDN